MLLSDLLRDCKDPDTAIRLSKRMDAIRRQIKPPVKKAAGRPRKEKPEPTVDPAKQELERLIQRKRPPVAIWTGV